MLPRAALAARRCVVAAKATAPPLLASAGAAAAARRRPLATIVPPPARPEIEKMPGEGTAGSALSGASDSRDMAAAEARASSDASGQPLGTGAPPPPPPPPPPPGAENEGEEVEAEVLVGPPVTAYAPAEEHPEEKLVPPSEVAQEGKATTVPKGEANTMAAPDAQGSG
jgi:hypothetical protein